MKTKPIRGLLLCSALILAAGATARAAVVFETTSPYHNIKVLDEAGVRTLSFDGSWESKMLLNNPLAGHFEYTEFFHLAWLWNSGLTNVLMLGLGGASTQRTFEHYYTNVCVETVEIDPAVLRVAKEYFTLKESRLQVVHLEDGRVYLRRSQEKYDAILMDAYTSGRYGSCIPAHLATKEFFELAASHLRTNGVLAYNVIGNLRGWRADLMGAVYKTLKTVFPEVYVFPARTSQNVVLIATTSAERANPRLLRERADDLIRGGKVALPTFRARLSSLRTNAPPTAASAPVLTDNFAPLEGLMNSGGQ